MNHKIFCKDNNYIRYYNTKPRENKKSLIAKKLEPIITLIIIWVVTILGILYFFNSSLPVLVIAIFSMALEYKLLNFISRYKQKKQSNHQKFFLAGNKCINNMDKIQSHNEFRKLVKEIILHTKGFSKIREYKSKEKSTEIDLIGYYNHVPIAIKCELTANNNLSVHNIREMVDSLDKLGYKSGIIVTNGLIDSSTKVMVDRLENDYALTVLDRYQLIEYARKAKHKIFPDDDMILQLLADNQKFKKEAQISLKNQLIGSRHKAINYFIAAIILVIMYSLIEGISFFGAIYLLFAAINIVLGVMSIFCGKGSYEIETIRSIKPDKKPG